MSYTKHYYIPAVDTTTTTGINITSTSTTYPPIFDDPIDSLKKELLIAIEKSREEAKDLFVLSNANEIYNKINQLEEKINFQTRLLLDISEALKAKS